MVKILSLNLTEKGKKLWNDIIIYVFVTNLVELY